MPSNPSKPKIGWGSRVIATLDDGSEFYGVVGTMKGDQIWLLPDKDQDNTIDYCNQKTKVSVHRERVRLNPKYNSTTKMLKHVLLVRPGVVVHFRLPSDITLEEVERLYKGLKLVVGRMPES